MDKLKECALIFKSLLNIEYKIILGRKGIQTEFSLNFKETDFHHLVGLQKLTDTPYAKGLGDKIFNDILNNDLTYDMISLSKFFFRKKNLLGVKERIDSFLNIIELLDSNDSCFKYSENRNKYSNIKCEYILENKDLGQIIYTFLDKRDDSDYRFCRSFFPKSTRDFTSGQTKMALLYKEKINLQLNESTILIDKPRKSP